MNSFEPLIEVQKVNKSFRIGERQELSVLEQVDFRMYPGEIVAILGPNAAGKTTTLRVIAGLKAPTTGAVRYRGEDITGRQPFERVRRGLVLVPEGRQIFPKFTVADNLLIGAYQRADRGALDGDLAMLYELFPRLAERRWQKGGSLSGGEQQMLAIARGLMARPRCLLLDEPSLGLAPIVVAEISRTVRKLAARGLTIVLVEQNAAMALDLADRAYVLESGRVSLHGDAPKLRETDVVKRLYLGA